MDCATNWNIAGFLSRGHGARYRTATRGYTAINAAFVLDLLGREGARPIREQVRDTLRALAEANPALLEDFWFVVTLGEAHLGLREFSEAKNWMERAARHRPHDWQLESTARQTAKLASLIATEMKIAPDRLPGSEPWCVVQALLGNNADAALSFLLGKVGLALSGGGFRASLFHIGFLARLAELDMLRHVEVLSCVSGGSILGAFYYLELRKLLQEKADEDLDRDDYVDLVRRIQINFSPVCRKISACGCSWNSGPTGACSLRAALR